LSDDDPSTERSAWRDLGPGLVAGVADDDPSAVGTYSQVGARFGLTFVWLPLLVLPIMAAAQTTAGRIGAVRREGLAAATKAVLPTWIAYAVFLPVVMANTFTLGADLHAMASATHLVVPLPELVLLIGLCVVILVLNLAVPYRRARVFLRCFAFGIVAYFGVLVAADVDWSAVGRAVVHPSLGAGGPATVALIALVGAALSPYVLVWQASVEVEEAALAPSSRPRRVRVAAVDVAAGVTVAMLAGAAIIVASATTLGAAGITQVDTADQAARALEPLLGSSAATVFALGILAVGLLAVPILAGGAAFATSELFGWRTGLGRRPRDVPAFSVVFFVAVAASLLFDVFGVGPVRALFLASIANGVAAPALLAVIVVIGRSRRGLGEHRIGRGAALLVGTGSVLTAALPVAYLVGRL